MRNRFRKYITKKLRSYLEGSSFNLAAGSQVSSSATISNSVLEGLINLCDKVTLSESKLKGAINIGESTLLKTSSLDGEINIERNCSVEESSFIGNINIAEGVNINRKCLLHGDISIGAFSSLNGPSIDLFTIKDRIIIGKFCSIARHVTIQEGNHTYTTLSANTPLKTLGLNKEIYEGYQSKGDIIIGNDVWIGSHSVILSGAQIGDGALIAANSVVNGPIPPFSIAAGSPAKVINYRFPEEVISKLKDLRWWNWDTEKIRRNEELFRGTITSERLQQIHE